MPTSFNILFFLNIIQRFKPITLIWNSIAIKRKIMMWTWIKAPSFSLCNNSLEKLMGQKGKKIRWESDWNEKSLTLTHCFHNAKFFFRDAFFFYFGIMRNRWFFQCWTIMHRMFTIYPFRRSLFFLSNVIFFFLISFSVFKVMGFFCERHWQFNTVHVIKDDQPP